VVDLEEAAGVEAVGLTVDAAQLLLLVRGFDRRVERDALVARNRLELGRLRQNPLRHHHAQTRQALGHGRGGHGTVGHVADAVRAALVVAEVAPHRVVLPARARAVAPDFGRRHHLDLGGRLGVRHAAQAVADDLGLGGELRLVGQLLKVAAAAAPEVGAGRLRAHVRGFEHFDDGSEGRAASNRLDAHAREVARRGQSDEERLPLGVREPDAARQDALDPHVEHRPCAQTPTSLRRLVPRRSSLILHGLKTVNREPSTVTREEQLLSRHG
jgi:hypothetical protein